MDKTRAVYKGNKYEAINERNEISIVLYRPEEGFRVSPYNKNLYKKEVKREDLTEFYREYFLARYKNYEIFVIRDFEDSKAIEIITFDPNIGEQCELDYQDRDLFTKRLGSKDDFQLIHVKEDYLHNSTTKSEVTLDEYFRIIERSEKEVQK